MGFSDLFYKGFRKAEETSSAKSWYKSGGNEEFSKYKQKGDALMGYEEWDAPGNPGTGNVGEGFTSTTITTSGTGLTSDQYSFTGDGGLFRVTGGEGISTAEWQAQQKKVQQDIETQKALWMGSQPIVPRYQWATVATNFPLQPAGPMVEAAPPVPEKVPAPVAEVEEPKGRMICLKKSNSRPTPDA